MMLQGVATRGRGVLCRSLCPRHGLGGACGWHKSSAHAWFAGLTQHIAGTAGRQLQSSRSTGCRGRQQQVQCSSGGGSSMAVESRRARLVVVGDVHGNWHPQQDLAALQILQPDMACFVGDFGNEDVELVTQVAQLPLPKAVILGNHDAWNTMIPRRGSPPPPPREQATEQAGEQAGEPSGPTSLTPEQEHDKALRASGALNNGTASGSYDAASGGSTDEAVTATVAEAGASSGSGGEGPGMGAAEAALAGVREPGAHYPTHRFPGGPNNGVIRQLLALGEAHVGYGALQIPGKQVAMVGGRPFSKGGKSFSGIAPFVSALYPGVSGLAESADRVAQVVQAQAGQGRDVVLMAHNAPTGLGEERYALAGVDWPQGKVGSGKKSVGKTGGDHGDPDLRAALDKLWEAGVRVPLILCGHMHNKLWGGQGHLRRMVHLDVERGTVTLNAATVPRVRKPGDPSSSAGSSASSSRSSSPAGRAKDGEQAANGGSSAGGGVEGSKGSASSRMSAAQRRLLAQAGVLSWRHFLVVTVADGMVEHAKDVWVEVQETDQGIMAHVAEEHEVLRTQRGEAGVSVQTFDGFFQRWVDAFVPYPRQQGQKGGAAEAEEAVAVGAAQ